jgi:hypothetical protein
VILATFKRFTNRLLDFGLGSTKDKDEVGGVIPQGQSIRAINFQ